MTYRIAINGYGRIGRCVLRAFYESTDYVDMRIVAINDLGPAGKSYSRASLSFANGKAYAHTIQELICIGK